MNCVLQVITSYPSKTLASVVDPEDASIVTLLQRKRWKAAARSILKHKELGEEVKSAITHAINAECTTVCSHKQDFILYKTSSEDLRTFSFKKLEADLKRLAPFLFRILSTVTKDATTTTCAAAAIALKGRQPQLSAFAHYINCILQYGGAKKAVFSRLSKMSISTTHQNAMVKQRELASKFDDGIRHLKGLHEKALNAVEEGEDLLLDVFRSMEDLCLSGEKMSHKIVHTIGLND